MTCEDMGRSEWVQEDHSLGTEKVREHKLSVTSKCDLLLVLVRRRGTGPRTKGTNSHRLDLERR